MHQGVAERHPEAAVVPRAPARCRAGRPRPRRRRARPAPPVHRREGPHGLAEGVRGYNRRALAETAVSRYKRVIGDALRSRTDRRRVTEVAIAARALNRMLELGRPESVRVG